MDRPTLRQGSLGPEVKELQGLLNRVLNPMPRLREDGEFGAMTRSAVLLFQPRAGLAADGEVGPATWDALQKADVRRS